MNIFAPASVPDHASLAQWLAGPPDAAVTIPGFAPPQSLHAGAGRFHSFESTLADLLSLNGTPEEKPEEDSKQQESKALITGVTIPATAAQPLPFHFALAFQVSVKADAAESGPGPAGSQVLSDVGQAANAIPRKSTPVPPAMLPGNFSAPRAFEPQAAPRGAVDPVLTVVEPRAATLPEFTSAAESTPLAFAETFTSVAASQDASALPAVRPAPGNRPADTTNNQAAGVTEALAANLAAPDHAPGQRHGNGERQHSSGESSSQRKDVAEPAGREAARVDNPRFEPLAPVSVSPREIPAAESSRPGSSPKPANLPYPEPNQLQALPPAHAPDTHAISVSVKDAGDTRVELKVTEHAGELKIAVRTADPDLASSLRENLGELVHKLEQSGFRADTWHATQAGSAEGSRQTTHAEGESAAGGHSGRQQQHSGEGRERKQQDHPERAGWIEELDQSFTPDSERKAPTWLPSVH